MPLKGKFGRCQTFNMIMMFSHTLHVPFNTPF